MSIKNTIVNIAAVLIISVRSISARLCQSSKLLAILEICDVSARDAVRAIFAGGVEFVGIGELALLYPCLDGAGGDAEAFGGVCDCEQGVCVHTCIIRRVCKMSRVS